MKNLFIFPHNTASQGAAELSGMLSARRIRRENSKYRGKKTNAVINWGCSSIDNPEITASVILNDPKVVATVTNKRNFFQMCHEAKNPPRIPKWSTNKDEVAGWMEKNPCTVFARTKLTGHSGEGIVEIKTIEELMATDAPLYVKYVPKKEEYRLHATSVDGLFDIQRKARRHAVEDPNWRIRNHANGFVYARSRTDQTPDPVKEEARKAFEMTGLDFGAVDVLWNEKRGEAYVLEINSAPGLEGTTVDKYAAYLRRVAEAKLGLDLTPLPRFVEPKTIREEREAAVGGWEANARIPVPDRRPFQHIFDEEAVAADFDDDDEDDDDED